MSAQNNNPRGIVLVIIAMSLFAMQDALIKFVFEKSGFFALTPYITWSDAPRSPARAGALKARAKIKNRRFISRKRYYVKISQITIYKFRIYYTHQRVAHTAT